MSLQFDLHDLVNGSGKQTNFSTMLLKLIFKADIRNLELLRKAYPNAVSMVESYRETGNIGNLESDQLKDSKDQEVWVMNPGGKDKYNPTPNR